MWNESCIQICRSVEHCLNWVNKSNSGGNVLWTNLLFQSMEITQKADTAIDKTSQDVVMSEKYFWINFHIFSVGFG